MIRAVIFDLDGVLIDAGPWHAAALNQALNLFGYHIGSKENAASYEGLPTSRKLELLSKQSHFPRSLHLFVEEMKQNFSTQMIETCQPNQCISRLLIHLENSGFLLGLASNSRRRTVDQILGKMELSDRFDVVLSQEEMGTPKPDPKIYFECARRIGIRPDEMLIIEDSMPGIQAARKATPHVLVVNHPSEVTEEAVDRAIRSANSAPKLENNNTLEILIPMAGQGSRFREVGYREPKPFIKILGKPMIQWVIDNITPTQSRFHHTFLCNAQHLREFPIEQTLRELSPECSVIEVPGQTAGAACTILLAEGTVDPSNPLLIANSDQFVDFSIDDFLRQAKLSKCDGSILTFPAVESKWSYAAVDSNGKVLQVAEKNPISPHATSGIYYFRKAQDFFEGAKNQIRQNLKINGEFYTCPVYNELIRQGKQIQIYEVEKSQMHGLGTPEDLATFLAR